MFVFCDAPDYGCHGWLRETWVCPDSYQSHLTAMFALTHLVLLAQCIAVLGVVGDDTANFSVTKKLPAHCLQEDVYFVCLIVCRSCMKQLPAPSKKGRLTGFCSTKWQREKGSLSCVPGEVEALQNGPVFSYNFFTSINAHVWSFLDEHFNLVVETKV